MITLIHGEDIVSARSVLDNLKRESAGNEFIYFNGSNLSLSDLATAIGSPSLFGQKKTIIIENLTAGGITKQKEDIISCLSSGIELPQIIILEKSEVSKANITKYFSKSNIIACKHPEILFKFVDSLGENTETVLGLFHSLLSQREAELIYVMMLRQFRYLIIAKGADEIYLKSLLKWQVFKFKNQAAKFTNDQLIRNYRNLLSLEYKIKAGLTPLTLDKLLDIFLTTL